MTHARQCTACGAGMNEGYVINGGCEHYCSDDCLPMTEAEFEEQYGDGEGDSYWTEWEDEPEEDWIP